MKLLSVVIPTWNREKEILRCLDSVNIAFKNALESELFEIIVTDNASTDDTLSVVNVWAERQAFPVSVITNSSNIGPMKNWSRGLSRASGDFCLLLFSDDYLVSSPELNMPIILEKMKSHNVTVGRLGVAMEDENGNLLSNKYFSVDFNSDKTDWEYTHSFICNHFARNSIQKLNLKNGFSPVSPTAYIIDRRSSIAALDRWGSCSNFAVHGAGIDQLMFLYPALQSKKIQRIPGLKAVMVASEGSITRKSQTDDVNALKLSVAYSYSGTLLIGDMIRGGGSRYIVSSAVIILRYWYQRIKLLLLSSAV